jgi:hypothetical protein
MPGLVKTKILSDELGRLQRLADKAAMLVVATSPEQAAESIAATIGTIRGGDIRDHYFSGAKDKGIRDIEASPQDIDRIWGLGTRVTNPWLT